MYVTCTPAEGGNVYRVYRRTERFAAEVRRLMPFLVQHPRVSQVFGGPDVLLRIGPLAGQVEREFQETLVSPGSVERTSIDPASSDCARRGRPIR